MADRRFRRQPQGGLSLRFLLDTQALILWTLTPSQLPKAAFTAIAAEGNEVWVSAVSLWEIVIKQNTGRLNYTDDLRGRLDEEGFELLGISFHHLAALRRLPLLHRDPFDRMLVAQAISEGMPIVTGDPLLRPYGAQVIWA